MAAEMEPQPWNLTPFPVIWKTSVTDHTAGRSDRPEVPPATPVCIPLFFSFFGNGPRAPELFCKGGRQRPTGVNRTGSARESELREKNPFSLYCTAGSDTRRFAAGAGPHFSSLHSGIRPAKWVRASARKKAFGSRSRQAKRSACPHPWMGKIRSRRREYRRHRRAPPCGEMRRQTSRIGTPPQRRNSGPNPARTSQEGQDPASLRRRAHSGSQVQTW